MTPSAAPVQSAADAAAEFSALHAWLRGRKRLLVLTHERPDGDALGSLLGCCHALQHAGIEAHGFLRQPLPARYSFLPLPANLHIGTCPADEAFFDGVFCLDTSNPDRLDRPYPLPAGVPVAQIDHHADNQRFALINVVRPDLAATAQALLQLFRSAVVAIPPAAAASLLAGLLMDTGGLRFGNTTAMALRDTADLLDAGAQFAPTVDALFFQESLGRRRLAARLLERAVFACNGRFAYSTLYPEWFTELNVAPADTEGLIDALRGIEGVEIACILQPEATLTRLSLRSRSMPYRIDTVAHTLGGGGHPLASGVKMPGVSLAEAEQRLLQEIKKVLEPT